MNGFRVKVNFLIMQSQKSIFLENYQILDIDKCQYLESACNSTPSVKFSRRFSDILKLPIKFFKYFCSELRRRISRKLLILAEEDKLQSWMRLPQQHFAKVSKFWFFWKKIQKIFMAERLEIETSFFILFCLKLIEFSENINSFRKYCTKFKRVDFGIYGFLVLGHFNQNRSFLVNLRQHLRYLPPFAQIWFLEWRKFKHFSQNAISQNFDNINFYQITPFLIKPKKAHLET